MNMFDYISNLKSALKKNGIEPKIAVHCHNDRGFALANALDTSVLGLGKRVDIVDLARLLVFLSSDYNLNNWDLTKLAELYEFVSKHFGVPIPVNYPVMGENAFTHYAGVHTHAAAVNPTHYESLSPELLGKNRIFSLDHMSGIASLRYAFSLLGFTYG